MAPPVLFSFGDFNPQGSREPRLDEIDKMGGASKFQSTRLSRASTQVTEPKGGLRDISIHKALASLDDGDLIAYRTFLNFNPQGSREPRLRT